MVRYVVCLANPAWAAWAYDTDNQLRGGVTPRPLIPMTRLVGQGQKGATMTSASCWICLEEEPDDDGKPPVRDCSCRGDAAGYAHLSCLTEYAKMKSMGAKGPKDHSERAWHICPNCNTHYQNQVRIDLSSAFLAFAETAQGRDIVEIMDALRVYIESISDVLMERTHFMRIPLSRSGGDNDELSTANTALRVDAENLVKRFLSLALQERKDKKAILARWAHMPAASEEYQLYKVCMGWEAYAYERLGLIYNLDHTREGWEIAVKHWERARVIFKMIGEHQSILNSVTNNLALARDRLTKPYERYCISTSQKDMYEYNIQRFGENDDRTIFSGISYAGNLFGRCHVESQRFATKISATSRQVLGPDHEYTKRADEITSRYKERFALVSTSRPLKSSSFCEMMRMKMKMKMNKPSFEEFQLLRYDEDEGVYVMMGPVKNPRDVVEEGEYRFPWDQVIPELGWPVVCHGLQSSSHLNGELGEVKHFYNTKTKLCIEPNLILLTFICERQWFRVTVHFMDKSLQPVAVKLENLRIVFDLPDRVQPSSRRGKRDKILIDS